jgi:hypothetical protein
VIGMVFFLLLGASFLVLLYFFWRRDRSSAEGGAEALLEAQEALNTLQFGLLPPELISRIFARQDMEYVESSTPQHIQEYFFNERRQITLLWIDQVRRQIVNLRRFYLGHSRSYAQISARTEVSLALNFAVLVSACRVLQLLVYVQGPLAAPRMVGATIAKAARVCEVSAKSLAFLKPMNPEGVSSNGTENEAPL